MVLIFLSFSVKNHFEVKSILLPQFMKTMYLICKLSWKLRNLLHFLGFFDCFFKLNVSCYWGDSISHTFCQKKFLVINTRKLICLYFFYFKKSYPKIFYLHKLSQVCKKRKFELSRHCREFSHTFFQIIPLVDLKW